MNDLILLFNIKTHKMHAYRFRLLFDEQEDFLRDFELLSSQTFADFHDLIKNLLSCLVMNWLPSLYVIVTGVKRKKLR